MQMTELVVGRELDALVARDVMGLTGTKRILLVESPDYSTSNDAAWRVVEKLRERFPQIDIELLPDRVTVTLWEQCRHDGDALDPLDEVVAGTMPLAVCRAALATVSHD